MNFGRRSRSLPKAAGKAAFSFRLALLFLAAFPFSHSAPADEKLPPVTFVAWNLKNYLAMERRVGGEVIPDAPKPEKEIEAVVNALIKAEPDILGICEIGDTTHLADLQERLRKKGLDLPHVELVVSADGWNRNLALLSRFPISERNSRDDLTFLMGQSRFPVQRGILDATLEINEGYRLRCIGVHLKSKREVPEGDQEEMRRNEAHLVRQHIDSALESDSEINLVVYGDFNDTPNEMPVRAIKGSFGSDGYLNDLRPADSMGFRWTHYWDAADTYARLDYALVNSGLRPEVVRKSGRIIHPDNWETASDHRPLVFQFTPREPGAGRSGN